MNELVLLTKDLVVFLWYFFIGAILLWLISHTFMMIYKTLFCDIQVKLYKTLKRRLKHVNDDELATILAEIKESKMIKINKNIDKQ